MRTERARCLMNTALRRRRPCMVTPAEIKALVPQLDLTGGGRYPILGASYHVEGCDGAPRPGGLGVRSRRVAARRRPPPAHAGHRAAHATATAWSASRRRADRSPPASSSRPSAAGSRAWPAMAGVRLPIRTHPLHAFVTNDYAPGLRAHRRQHGARCATSRRPSAARCSSAPSSTPSRPTRASRRSSALRSYTYKITQLLPFLRDHAHPAHVGRDLRHLDRLLSPIMGFTPARRLPASRPAGAPGASRPSRPAARRWPS